MFHFIMWMDLRQVANIKYQYSNYDEVSCVPISFIVALETHQAFGKIPRRTPNGKGVQ